VVDLGLVAGGADPGAAVVAECEPGAGGDRAFDRAKRSVQTSRTRSAAAKRSIRLAASYQRSFEAWSTITNTAQRPSWRVHASVASVA
jgi:hypothetical protein